MVLTQPGAWGDRRTHRGHGSSPGSPVRPSAALSRAPGFRTNWMQIMIIQIQKATYGKYQNSSVQKNLEIARPTPLAIPHQPSQRPTSLVDRMTQPQHTAKLPIASQILASPRLAVSNA